MDVSKFTIDINSDGSLTFHSDGWPDLKLTKKTVAVAALSGHYEGQVPFILDMNLIFPGDGTMNFDQNVKVAKIEIKCPTEKIAGTASTVTFPNIAAAGDCMGDALRKQKKDVSKFTIDINSDGTLTFHSDGWPDLKLNKKTTEASENTDVAAFKSVLQVTCPKSCDTCRCSGCKNITVPLGKCAAAGQGAGVIGSCNGAGTKFTEEIYLNAKCQGQSATRREIYLNAKCQGQ